MFVRNKAIKDSKTLITTKAIVFVIFLIYAITLIFPFLWMILNAFKTNKEFFADIWSLPKNPITNGVDNFLYAIQLTKKDSNVIQMTLRSVFITVVGVSLSMISSLMISYTIAKYKFPGRNLMYSVIIAIMLIPTIGATSSMYKLMNDLQIFDTYFSLFLMGTGGLGFQFLMLHGVFKSISWSYAEAAMVDGASDFRIFTTVMIPLAGPTIIPLMIMNIIGSWNDYFTPYLYLPSKPTLAVGLQMLVNQTNYNANWPALFMLMLISMLPIIVLFIVFQKQIMTNVTTGGLKG